MKFKSPNQLAIGDLNFIKFRKTRRFLKENLFIGFIPIFRILFKQYSMTLKTFPQKSEFWVYGTLFGPALKKGFFELENLRLNCPFTKN